MEPEVRRVSMEDLKKKILPQTPFSPNQVEEMLYTKFDEQENFVITHHNVRYVVVYNDLADYFSSKPAVLPGETISVDPIGSPIDPKAALPKKSRQKGKDAKMPFKPKAVPAKGHKAGMGKAPQVKQA